MIDSDIAKNYKYPDVMVGDMIKVTHVPMISLDDPRDITYRECDGSNPVHLVLKIVDIVEDSRTGVLLYTYTVMNLRDGRVYNMRYGAKDSYLIEVIA